MSNYQNHLVGAGWLMRRILFVGAVICAVPLYAQNPVLVIHESDPSIEMVIRGIASELDDDVPLIQCVINSLENPWLPIATILEREKPAAVILMKQRAVDAYQEYIAFSPTRLARQIPVVCLMTSGCETPRSGIVYAGGISREIPVVTSMLSLRMLLNIKLTSVGIVTSSPRSPMLQRDVQYCVNEGMDVIKIPVTDVRKYGYRYYRRYVRDLIAINRMEALVIGADSQTLSPEMISKVWEPLSNSLAIPIVLNGRVPDHIKTDFATLMVTPDDFGYGIQAASKVLDLKDAGWKVTQHQYEPPISVYKVANCFQLPRLGILSGIKLETVDQLSCATR